MLCGKKLLKIHMDLRKKLVKPTDKKFKGCQTQRLCLWFLKSPSRKPLKAYKHTKRVLVLFLPNLQMDSGIQDNSEVGQTSLTWPNEGEHMISFWLLTVPDWWAVNPSFQPLAPWFGHFVSCKLCQRFIHFTFHAQSLTNILHSN